MQKKTMKYIIHYATEKDVDKRNISLAAKNKADYIISSLNRLSFVVEVISPSGSKSSVAQKGKFERINGQTTLKTFNSLGRKNLFKRVVDYFYRNFQVLFYMFRNLKQDDVVLIYHSLALISIVKIMKLFKKFKMILEVEEIYTDVIMGRRKAGLRNKELNFFKLADAYFFSTDLLEKQINNGNKPYVIINGVYSIADSQVELFDDGKVHVIYSGTLDPRKGGAEAISAAEFLDANYHIHILGFGNQKEVEQIIEIVEQVSSRTECGVSYDGVLSGEEYSAFLQSCDVGLSTQNPDAAFNLTSFPSKVLTYFSNGLNVVSIRLDVLESSSVGDLINYYDSQSPECIANAIKNRKRIEKEVIYERLKSLDFQTQKDLNNLLNADVNFIRE
ncbi:MAG: hypothetical protein ACOX6G_08695 [Christensenellales bacterium]|jgi:glycosyltransferase involved in cell wall biosynthesis